MITTFSCAASIFASLHGLGPAAQTSDVFPDIPANHWAAKAVLDLRKSGILDGYPGGRFGG